MTFYDNKRKHFPTIKEMELDPSTIIQFKITVHNISDNLLNANLIHTACKDLGCVLLNLEISNSNRGDGKYSFNSVLVATISGSQPVYDVLVKHGAYRTITLL